MQSDKTKYLEDMESIGKNISEEEFESVEQNISTEEEKGSGKGKLPENKLTTEAAVSFQKPIVDSTFTRTTTISKTLQIQTSSNLIETDDSLKDEKILEVRVDLDISDQQTHLSKDDITYKGTDNDDDENKSKWAQESTKDEEMLVVVVEECHENDEHLKLQTEEETISAASTPDAYGKREIYLRKLKIILMY